MPDAQPDQGRRCCARACHRPGSPRHLHLCCCAKQSQWHALALSALVHTCSESCQAGDNCTQALLCDAWRLSTPMAIERLAKLEMLATGRQQPACTGLQQQNVYIILLTCKQLVQLSRLSCDQWLPSEQALVGVSPETGLRPISLQSIGVVSPFCSPVSTIHNKTSLCVCPERLSKSPDASRAGAKGLDIQL